MNDPAKNTNIFDFDLYVIFNFKIYLQGYHKLVPEVLVEDPGDGGEGLFNFQAGQTSDKLLEI